MAYQNLLLQRLEGPDQGVAVLTVNRPQVRNALNRETWVELEGALTEVRRDPGVKVLIMTGAGDKSFAAGADVAFLHDRSMLETLEAHGHAVLRQLETLDRPVIAAINGYALGGGCELAMACDIRIASENARFGQPEAGLGFMPGGGGTVRLPRLVGPGRAKELIFTGDTIDAREAERIGLVNRVVPQAELMPACLEVARKIMSRAPLAVSVAKLIINGGMGLAPEPALLLERLAQTVLFTTRDRVEGTAAFLEKRPPRFEGR